MLRRKIQASLRCGDKFSGSAIAFRSKHWESGRNVPELRAALTEHRGPTVWDAATALRNPAQTILDDCGRTPSG